MRKIYVSDMTLKEVSKNRDAGLLFREKTAIAASLCDLGVDGIELPPVQKPREDSIIYHTISSMVQDGEVVIPAGVSEENIQEAWECVKEAKNPVLQVELPVSTVQMEYMFHVKGDKMLGKIKALCAFAKTLCDKVEFVAADASRAERDFLFAALSEALESGATRITLSDDAGILLPEEMAELVKAVKKEFSAMVFVKASDRLHMAASNAFAAIMAGADGVKAAMVGKEVLQTGEISDILSEKGDMLSAYTDLKNIQIHTGVEALLKNLRKGGYQTEKSPQSGKADLLLDADSTLPQVCDASEALGYHLSDEDNELVYKTVLSVCEKKGSVGADELEAIIASYAMQAPSTYHLESYTTSCGSLIGAMTQIQLKREDEIFVGVSVGDGPIDAAFRAIENSIGCHYELDDFRIQAVTEGKEALGNAVVRLRNNGKLYSGNGISADIVGASIRAYLNALNKIVFEEE